MIEDDVRTAIRSLNEDTELAEIIAEHLARLQTILKGQRPDRPMHLAGTWGQATADPFTDPITCIKQQIISLSARKSELKNRSCFCPGTTGHVLYVTHFIDALLGSQVYDLDGNGNWQNKYLDREVGTLTAPDIDSHPAWNIIKRCAMFFKECELRSVYYETPVVSSPLNTAVNLYGQEFLISLYEEPEAAHHDLRVITDVIIAVNAWFIDHMPADSLQVVGTTTRFRPPGYGHLCGCTSQLVGADQYQEFIVPYNEEILSLFPHGGMIHICGSHTQHIPAWRAMDQLAILQTNDRASVDLEQYIDGLRDDQVLYNLHCPDMPWERADEIAGGRRIVHTFITSP